MSTGLNSIIRADGNPQFAMLSMLLGAVVNTTLDPVFIFQLHWGVKVAAFATIFGQIISFIVSLLSVFKLRSVKIERTCFGLNGKILRLCLSLGVSNFITQIAIVIMSALCNNLMTKYGAFSKYGSEIPMTVLGIVMKVNQILLSVLVGISVGAHPILVYNYGAGNMKRVKKTYGIMLSASIIVGAVGFVVFEFFPQSIVNIFCAESDLYNEFALKAVRTFCLCVFQKRISSLSTVDRQTAAVNVLSAFKTAHNFCSGCFSITPFFWRGRCFVGRSDSIFIFCCDHTVHGYLCYEGN
ncbi:MAG: MATE family efflux transporter [Ruminococcus flavefaciens]|nr:MATE family efflux transporter [Ruminococcus flavefaciens]MCM1058773.1 MATE family efflux transporter [Eubacterium sp.]